MKRFDGFIAGPPVPREVVWRAIDNEEIFPYGPIQETDDPGYVITRLDYENGIVYLVAAYEKE